MADERLGGLSGAAALLGHRTARPKLSRLAEMVDGAKPQGPAPMGRPGLDEGEPEKDEGRGANPQIPNPKPQTPNPESQGRTGKPSGKAGREGRASPSRRFFRCGLGTLDLGFGVWDLGFGGSVPFAFVIGKSRG